MIKTDTRGRRGRPAKAVPLDDFRIKAYPTAIPPHDPDTVAPLRAEHMKSATERIKTAIPDQGHQRRRTLAEVNRLAGDINHDAGRDHALRTTCRIFAK
jgi:hypothetical protein